MTSRSHNSWLRGAATRPGIIAGLAAVAVTVLPVPVRAQVDGPITAFVNRDGRVVFTNIATPVPAPGSKPVQPASTPDSASGRRSGVYDGLIDRIALRHGIDPELVRAVIAVESNFDRRAVSPKGARGLMQLIPSTGLRFGVRDYFDPAQNIEGGVRYLRTLLAMFEGNLDLTLAAYNSGENRVVRLGRIPEIRETQDYVRKVRNTYAINAGALPASAVGRQSASLTHLDQAVGEDRAISSSVDERGVVSFSNLGSFR
jgi:soluble lytic murein transglycosylase-like protein